MKSSLIICLGLLALMAATRFHHFGDMSLMHYVERVAKYYPPYLGYSAMYIALVALGTLAYKALRQVPNHVEQGR